MRKIAALFFTLFFLATATEAVGLISQATGVLKCPLCKMKMQKIDDCRCHKKKPISAAKIHDPCGDDEGDFHISFDRLSAILSAAEAPVTLIQTERTALPLQTLQSYIFEVSTPPPRA